MSLHVKFTLMSDISDCSTFLHFAVQLPNNLIQEVTPSCPWFSGRMVTHEALALKAPLRQLERTLYSSIASHTLRWKDRFGMWWLRRLIRTFHRRRDVGVSLRKEAAAPSPIRRGPCFRPVKSSSRLSFHSSWTRTWAVLIVLWDLWNYSQHVPHGVERASASLSVWPFIIIGLTQAHRVTSELLLPLLRTAGGGKKSPLENNLSGHLQANEQMNWRGAERCVLRTEHASEGDLSSRSFICASLGKWCSGVQRKSSLFVNENEEQRYRESSSHQKVGWLCHFVPSGTRPHPRLLDVGFLSGAPGFRLCCHCSLHCSAQGGCPHLLPSLSSSSAVLASLPTLFCPFSRLPAPFLLSQVLWPRKVCRASCWVDFSNSVSDSLQLHGL